MLDSESIGVIVDRVEDVIKVTDEELLDYPI
jgi:chemotaxis signal transduction protein